MVKRILIIILVLVFGITFGGIIFSRVQPRSFLAIKDCGDTCLKKSDLAGLVVSLGINYAPDSIPNVILETDKTLVIKHPRPEAPIHYVIVPKKDIKNISLVSEENKTYLTDAFAVISNIIQEKGWKKYRVITNGPGYQDVTYLHLHLLVYDK